MYAFIEDISASGGYLIACAADLIYVSRFSLVGSIGAVMTTFSAVPLLEKIGIEPKIFTAGCRKAGPNPMVQMSEEEEEDINNLLKYTHKEFIEWVESRRGGKIKSNTRADVFSGACFGGKQSVELGLTDDVYTVVEDTIATLIQTEVFTVVRVKNAQENMLSWFIQNASFYLSRFRIVLKPRSQKYTRI